MGIYEFVYDCGCVDISTTLSVNDVPSFCRICQEHKLKIGNKFKYSLHKFIYQYWRKENDRMMNFDNNYVYDVEVIDIVQHHSKKYDIVKFKTNFDTTHLNPLKKIYFSEFNDEPSWSNIDDYSVLILIFETKHISRASEKQNLGYDWKNHDVYELQTDKK